MVGIAFLDIFARVTLYTSHVIKEQLPSSQRQRADNDFAEAVSLMDDCAHLLEQRKRLTVRIMMSKVQRRRKVMRETTGLTKYAVTRSYRRIAAEFRHEAQELSDETREARLREKLRKQQEKSDVTEGATRRRRSTARQESPVQFSDSSSFTGEESGQELEAPPSDESPDLAPCLSESLGGRSVEEHGSSLERPGRSCWKNKKEMRSVPSPVQSDRLSSSAETLTDDLPIDKVVRAAVDGKTACPNDVLLSKGKGTSVPPQISSLATRNRGKIHSSAHTSRKNNHGRVTHGTPTRPSFRHASIHPLAKVAFQAHLSSDDDDNDGYDGERSDAHADDEGDGTDDGGGNDLDLSLKPSLDFVASMDIPGCDVWVDL